jgi:hypothetical protein
VQSSLVIALFTINTTHFNMEQHLFLGIMASHGFEPNEFKPRAPSAALPPPFGAGPPLGQGLTESRPSATPAAAAANSGGSRTSMADSRVASGAVARRGGGGGGGGSSSGGAALSKAQKAVIARIEGAGGELVRQRGLPASLAREYPFMLMDADTLFLKDVRQLLEEYRRVVLQYESLKTGLAADGLR